MRISDWSSDVCSSDLYGIGVDILRVERMEKLLDRHGQKLLNRLLCAKELREVRARKNRARALAMCWAAKEAFVKALGTGFDRSEEHTSELQSLMRISYAVFCLQKKNTHPTTITSHYISH